MLIFMQVGKKKSICYPGQVHRNLASTHFRLILYGIGQAASQRKKEQKLHPRDADMHPKKILETSKGVIPVERTLFEKSVVLGTRAGQRAAKQKGDIIAKHGTAEITTNIIHPNITCSVLSYTSRKQQKRV